MPRHIEHKIQSAFFDLVRLHEQRWPDLEYCFSVPNGEGRARTQNSRGQWYSLAGQRLRKEGARPGVPDVWFPIPRGPWTGWLCEFKAPRGYPRPKQRLWLDRMEAAGWQVHVFRDAEEAWESLKSYVELEL